MLPLIWRTLHIYYNVSKRQRSFVFHTPRLRSLLSHTIFFISRLVNQKVFPVQSYGLNAVNISTVQINLIRSLYPSGTKLQSLFLQYALDYYNSLRNNIDGSFSENDRLLCTMSRNDTSLTLSRIIVIEHMDTVAVMSVILLVNIIYAFSLTIKVKHTKLANNGRR